MKLSLSCVAVAVSVAALVLGCDKSDGASSSAGPVPATSAAGGGAKAVAVEASKEAPKAAALTPGDFFAKLTPATCNWFDKCKNDKVKALASMTGMMIAGFGTLDKPDLAKQVQGVGDAMKKDKRAFPNKDECATIGGVVMQLSGMTGDAVQAKIGKTVQYNADKAAACLAAFDSGGAACATEFKVEGEPKMSEIEGYEKEVKPQLDAQLKVCGEALEGMVEAGQACEYDFECKGENSNCKGAAGAKKCEAGKEKK